MGPTLAKACVGWCQVMAWMLFPVVGVGHDEGDDRIAPV